MEKPLLLEEKIGSKAPELVKFRASLKGKLVQC